MLRILDYKIIKDEKDNRYNEGLKKKAKKGFVIGFHLYCEKCKLDDHVKVSNLGWQSGSWNNSPVIRN